VYIWRRSLAYRLYVVLGLAGVVAAVVLSAVANSDDPGSRTPLYVGVGAVGAWLVGLIVLQFLRLRTDLEDGGAPSAREPAGSGSGPPQGYGAMLEELAAGPVDRRAAERALQRMRRGTMRWFGLTAALALGFVGGMAIYLAGMDGTLEPFGEGGIAIPYAVLPPLAVVAVLALRTPITLKRAIARTDDLLRPLGLATAAMPQHVFWPRMGGGGVAHSTVGPTVIGGHRHGRPVEVRLDVHRWTTTVAAPAPRFRVREEDGRLLAEADAPPGVVSALAALPPDERWRGVEAQGGPEGVVVDRDASRALGEAGWLDDLWLAERLLAAGGQSSR
jgi:hypothetical protein